MHRLPRVVAGLERNWPYVLAVLSLVFVAVTVILDSKRPLWNDELFTLYISRQQSVHDLWSALMTGADQSPFLFFIIVRAFTGFFGATVITLRLPETLGFLLMNICTFLFVRRRVPAPYGFVAFLFPAVTDAYSYAFEGRPYGLVMGFCGLAMLFWQDAARGRKRPLSLVGIAVFLGLAINSHYYAVLLLIPFGIAELVRFYGRKRSDWPLYIAIGAAVVSLVFSLPIIRASSNYASHFWAKPSWTSMISFYENLLGPAALALVLLTIVPGVALYLGADARPETGWEKRPAKHELGLAFGFLLIPVVAICIAKFVTGAFAARYAIYAIIGFSILIAWSVAGLCRGNRVVAMVLAVGMTGCWFIVAVRRYQQFVSNEVAQEKTFRLLTSASSSTSNLPVVIESPHEFFLQSHVAAGEHSGHFVYLADVPLALKYTETDSVERELLVLKRYAPLDLQDYRSFARNHPRFLLYCSPDAFGWVSQDLMKSRWRLSLKGRSGEGVLYLVESPSSLAL